MKKLIFSALVATALFVSSCGKDDDNGGGSTSLNGDWYLYAIYKNQEKKWASPNDCAKQIHYSFSDTQIKHEWYHLEGSECKYTPIYYDYTLSDGIINLTIANNSPNGIKGQKVKPAKYEMKGKELIQYYEGNYGFEETIILHKKGVDYSYLDPFVGHWKMTKATVGQTEAIVQEGKCLDGEVVATSLGFTFYLEAPNKSGQCQETFETFKWVKEGNKYYDITDPQKKEELVLVFSDNNTKLSYSAQSQSGLVTFYFTKEK